MLFSAIRIYVKTVKMQFVHGNLNATDGKPKTNGCYFTMELSRPSPQLLKHLQRLEMASLSLPLSIHHFSKSHNVNNETLLNASCLKIMGLTLSILRNSKNVYNKMLNCLSYAI